MQAFGATVEVISGPSWMTVELLAGYRTLADELLTQLPGPPAIHAFCSFVGTAGCFVGTTRELVPEVPDLWRVVVEPAESAVLSAGPAGAHHIEGGGFGYRPSTAPPRRR
jgi:cysteine synthase A